MQNHDVMRREQAACAAFSSVARILDKEFRLPARAVEAIEEVCRARLYVDRQYILDTVVRANLGYWKRFGLVTAIKRKIGIGEHPFRQERQG
jgi:hypothetical protein